VHISGKGTNSGQAFAIDMTLSKGSGGKGTITIDSDTLTLVNTGSTVYIKADKAYWTKYANATAAAVIGDRWVKAPASDASYTDLASLADFGKSIDSYLKPTGTPTKDIMGYCDPKWISNYNYKALFARLQTINGADMQVPTWDTPRPYRMVRVLEDGTATVGDRIDVNAPLYGEERTVSVTLSDGTTRSLTGNYYAYDHVSGGYVMVPEAGKVTVVKAKILL